MLLLNSIEYPVVQDIKHSLLLYQELCSLVILNLDQFPKRYKIKIKFSLLINLCSILLALDPTVSSMIFKINESEIPKCLTQFSRKTIRESGCQFSCL